MIVLRKLITHKKGYTRLFDEIRYFFYITNNWASDAEDLVFEANDRCDQENLIAQLSGGVRSLSAPVDNLNSNWAYMVMTCLAWNLKAWWALWAPESGRWRETHRAEKHRVLRMEFRTFLNAFIKIPCQIVRAGGKLLPGAELQSELADILSSFDGLTMLTERTMKPESGRSGAAATFHRD